jgi:hypothetical protein
MVSQAKERLRVSIEANATYSMKKFKLRQFVRG